MKLSLQFVVNFFHHEHGHGHDSAVERGLQRGVHVRDAHAAEGGHAAGAARPTHVQPAVHTRLHARLTNLDEAGSRHGLRRFMRMLGVKHETNLFCIKN